MYFLPRMLFEDEDNDEEDLAGAGLLIW